MCNIRIFWWRIWSLLLKLLLSKSNLLLTFCPKRKLRQVGNSECIAGYLDSLCFTCTVVEPSSSTVLLFPQWVWYESPFLLILDHFVFWLKEAESYHRIACCNCEYVIDPNQPNASMFTMFAKCSGIRIHEQSRSHLQYDSSPSLLRSKRISGHRFDPRQAESYFSRFDSPPWRHGDGSKTACCSPEHQHVLRCSIRPSQCGCKGFPNL